MNKEERKEVMRALIDRQQYDQTFNRADAATVNTLTGWCFSQYRRVRNPTWKTDTRCVAHSKDDGATWEIWSWNKAIDNRVKFYDLQQAMREAVSSQIRRYAASAENKCANCESQEFLTVDHKDKPFIVFVRDFLKANSKILDAISNDATGAGWYIADPEVKEKWVLYHKVNATYQVLCRSCNAKKGAKHDTDQRQA